MTDAEKTDLEGLPTDRLLRLAEDMMIQRKDPTAALTPDEEIALLDGVLTIVTELGRRWRIESST